MVDTFTPALRLTKPEINANNDAWEALLNSGMIALLDDSIAGEIIIDVTSAFVTLSEIDGATDESRMMFITAFGSPGGTAILVTAAGGSSPKLYVVTNNSDDLLAIGPTGGPLLAILPGCITMCYADGPAGGMKEVTTFGEFIAKGTFFDTAMGQITLDILPTPGGGATTITAQYGWMGAFVFFTFEEFLSTAVPGTTFSLLPTGGNWGVIRPAGEPGIVPFITHTFPMTLYEDTGGGMLPVDALVTVSSGLDGTSVTPWTITKVDGTAFTNPSDRQTLRATTLFYPTQANV